MVSQSWARVLRTRVVERGSGAGMPITLALLPLIESPHSCVLACVGCGSGSDRWVTMRQPEMAESILGILVVAGQPLPLAGWGFGQCGVRWSRMRQVGLEGRWKGICWVMLR